MTTPIKQPEVKIKDNIVIYFLASSNPLDIEACKIVHNHLSQFIRNSTPPIEIYSDYSIDAGVETINYKDKLYSSDLVIVFGSSDFIADEDLSANRINKVILRYNKRETRILAIIVRNFLWTEPFFGHLPILPKERIPLYDQKTWSIDDAFATVAQEIKDKITKIYKIEQSTIEIKPWDD
ncbi:type 1 glutamine amidotransferase family protein [Algoriphagus antarcticus]|uniref:TIR domain-containing protein n=1 Tax=Algoriphagus antarcticus TaxID=238540 RepID=A0A3E0DL80_9BACT|nr:hypothetical protein [Algoriphagus antarcticus]REG82290.1 hypothetical protein C8N25_12236 [Algoriphagus antarcticus]